MLTSDFQSSRSFAGSTMLGNIALKVFLVFVFGSPGAMAAAMVRCKTTVVAVTRHCAYSSAAVGGGWRVHRGGGGLQGPPLGGLEALKESGGDSSQERVVMKKEGLCRQKYGNRLLQNTAVW